MKLEPLDFIDALPKENSPDFLNLVTENWKNLVQNNLEGKNCYAAILYRQLKPKRNKRNKFYVFILWLYLCFERPLEKGWKYSIKEKDPVFDKIYQTLDDLLIEYPDLDLPDIQTLRRYVKKENFKEIISSLPFKQTLMKFEKIFKFVSSPIRMVQDRRAAEQLKLIFKFMDIIESQRWIKKRDLYKKLRIKKDDCDQLLKKAEEEGFVRTKEYTNKTIWITYADPKD